MKRTPTSQLVNVLFVLPGARPLSSQILVPGGTTRGLLNGWPSICEYVAGKLKDREVTRATDVYVAINNEMSRYTVGELANEVGK